MEIITQYLLAGLLSIAVGTAYYFMMSKSIPKESNCSFSATIWTDIFAFAVGIALISMALWSQFKGSKQWFNLVIFVCGMAIIVEHIWQAVFNKL
jgi:hypothetical protein